VKTSCNSGTSSKAFAHLWLPIHQSLRSHFAFVSKSPSYHWLRLARDLWELRHFSFLVTIFPPLENGFSEYELLLGTFNRIIQITSNVTFYTNVY
jgi:hypothetical protein